MLFRQYAFESPLSPTEFLLRLRAMVTERIAMLASKRGHIYGKVGDGGFDLRTPSTTRGNVIWGVGPIDPEARNASGTLREVPEPTPHPPLLIVVAAAIGPH